MNSKLHRLVEGDLVLAQEVDAPGGADARDARVDAVRVHALGLRALEACEDGPVGAVPAAGQGKRAIQAHGDLGRLAQQSVALKPEHELPRGPHGPHGVGAGRPDADLEDVKNA